MKVAVYSARDFGHESLQRANVCYGHQLTFLEPRLTHETAPLAAGCPAVSIFVNDHADTQVLEVLHSGGTGLIALRCAGFNNVDLAKAHELAISIAHVPAYSPYAVAEHTVGLMLALNRKIHRAYARVREGNFTLAGLEGFDLNERTVGVIGTGRIGMVISHILHGFGCRLLGVDVARNSQFASIGRYVPLDELLAASEIITLHCPLTHETHHLIDAEAIRKMIRGMMLINTSRGALIDTPAVIDALKSGQIGYLGLDVYEEEADLFFTDLSDEVIQDDVFARLLTFPNVIITGHQAFFTRQAVDAIANTTLQNVSDFESGGPVANEVTLDMITA